MNRAYSLSVLLLQGSLGFLSLGCGGDSPLVLGEAMDPESPTPLQLILEHPEEYLGREVTVQGRIGPVCQQMGCWFYLQEEDRILLVDLQHGRRFTVPRDSAGRWAVITGEIQGEVSDLRIVGRAARIEDSR